MHNAINNTRDLLPDHFASLLHERPAGSRWGRPFTEADFELPWREADLDGAAFARAFPAATLGAVPYSRLCAADRAAVYRVDGAHGPELRIDRMAIARPVEAWLIVGPHDGHEVVFTAHPGPVMLPLHDRALDPALPLAVKRP
jgi:hypothetical protein